MTPLCAGLGITNVLIFKDTTGNCSWIAPELCFDKMLGIFFTQHMLLCVSYIMIFVCVFWMWSNFYTNRFSSRRKRRRARRCWRRGHLAQAEHFTTNAAAIVNARDSTVSRSVDWIKSVRRVSKVPLHARLLGRSAQPHGQKKSHSVRTPTTFLHWKALHGNPRPLHPSFR